MASDEERALMAASLDAVGVSLSEVETVVVGGSGSTLATEFERGSIDPYAGSIQDTAAISAVGIEVRSVLADAVRNTPSGAIFVSEEYLELNPETVEGFLRAFAKASHLGEADPAFVEEIVRERVPEEWENELVGRALYESVLQSYTPYENMYGEVRAEYWESTSERPLAVGELEAAVDVSPVLTPTSSKQRTIGIVQRSSRRMRRVGSEARGRDQSPASRPAHWARRVGPPAIRACGRARGGLESVRHRGLSS